MEPAVLQHLLGSLRGSGSAGAAPAFDNAASQLQLLGGPVWRSGQAGELAEELLDKAEQLVGSKQVTSRLLGLQLLRSAIANCHRRTFLQQHAQWAALLLATVRAEQPRGQQADKEQAGAAAAQQQPSAVAAEACACLAAYFGRVGRMLEVPGLRRDGAAAASKLAGLLLGQGQKQQAAAGQAAAAAPPLLALPQGQAALLAALTALPSSFRQQHKALEAALLPLLMAPGAAGGGSSPLLAACAAALPRIAGDGSSWSACCQRLLATAHRLLDSLLLQLDDAQLAAAAKSAVDPSAEPLPLLPAAGSTGALSSEAYAAAFGQLAAVLETLHQLLVGGYPSAVPLPAGGLLLLASRVASVDDSSGGRAATAAAASSRFPQLCLQLPAMQAAALRLLQQTLAAAGSAAAPYFVAAARLLGDLLQRSAAGGGAVGTSATVRARLFSAARTLLDTAGVGAVRPLAPPLLAAATAELYGRKQAAQQNEDGAEGPARKKARKGKQATVDFAGEAAAAAPLDDLGAAAQLRDQAVQAAALEALEALCSAGASLLAPHQRRQLDDLAAHVAATSAAAACQISCDAEAAVGAGLAALQLSAHRLLLATVLAPAPHRPPHLAAALRLWRAGSAGGAGGSVPAFCRHALLCCEALLHPRSLPPPAGVRRMLPAAAELGADGGEEAGPPLGMPRFWSSVDATLLLQQEELAVQRQLAARPAQQQAVAAEAAPAAQQQPEQQPQANGVAQAADVEMADAPVHVTQAQQHIVAHVAAPAAVPAAAAAAAPAEGAPPSQRGPVQKAPAAGLSSMAAMLGGAAAPAAAAAVQAAVPSSAAAPQPAAAAVAPAPEFAAAPAALAAAPAPAAAAVLAAAAAAEESDSEGSLPEIDSGEDSSGSDSDEA